MSVFTVYAKEVRYSECVSGRKGGLREWWDRWVLLGGWGEGGGMSGWCGGCGFEKFLTVCSVVVE